MVNWIKALLAKLDEKAKAYAEYGEYLAKNANNMLAY